MSMSTHVVAFRAPDEKWKKMKIAYDACLSVNIPVPKGIDDFFGNEPPDDSGVEVDIENLLTEFNEDSTSGYQLDLTKLPKDVTILRFYNSW